MHIIRQKTKGDWKPVFDETKQILENYLIRHLDVID
jgi:Tfp pilus assembly protein PilP